MTEQEVDYICGLTFASAYVGIVLGFVVICVGNMVVSWRSKRKKQRDEDIPPRKAKFVKRGKHK